MLHNKYALHSTIRVIPLKGSPIVGILCTFPFLLCTRPVGRPHNYRGTKLLSYRLPWVMWASTMCCNVIAPRIRAGAGIGKFAHLGTIDDM